MSKKKWYEPHHLVWGLFATLGLIIGSLAGSAWGKMDEIEERSWDNYSALQKIEAHYEDLIDRLKRIEKKIDEMNGEGY